MNKEIVNTEKRLAAEGKKEVDLKKDYPQINLNKAVNINRFLVH